MASRRAGLRQRSVLFLEPSRRAATIGYSIVACLAAAGVVVMAAHLYTKNPWPARLRPSGDIPDRSRLIAEGVAVGIAVLALVAAFINARRWRIARVVERLSNDPAMRSLMPDTEQMLPSSNVARVSGPPLEVRFIKPRRLPRPRGLRRVTATSNVVGLPPMQIAYLRLFENQPRSRTFVQGAWREFGCITMLRSAATINPTEYRRIRRSKNLGGIFIDADSELMANLTATVAPLRKGWHTFRNVAPTTIRVRDRYGSYPPNAMLCHGAYWRRAVDFLLNRADAVVLDLSGLTPKNRGTLHELQRVIDRFPIERAVFLADQRSNRGFLESLIREAWALMEVTSPNNSPRVQTVRVAITDRYVRIVQQDQSGQTTNVQTKLVAHRAETRRLAASVNKSLVAHSVHQ